MPQYLTKLGQLSSLVDHIAQEVAKVVPCISATNPGFDEFNLPSVDEFVLYVTVRSCTTVPELILSLVYLSRFQQNLSSCAIGRPSAPHRLFITALNLAHKIHNDDSPDNACWSQLSSIPEYGFLGFSKFEVNLMERQFLAVLDWNVHIDLDF
ncbi:Cyclin [Pyrenophora tritici-repentis]|nr:Cyclin [Pyrenophora tritici-repentis]